MNMKKTNQRPARARTRTPTRKIQNTVHEGEKAAEAVATDPLYRRAMNLASVVGVLGVAWFTIQATRRWIGNRNDVV